MAIEKRVSVNTLMAFGAGVCVGAGTIVIVRMLTKRTSLNPNLSADLTSLRDSIDQLRVEIAQLRDEQPEVVHNLVPSMSRKGYYSVYPSSGEDDDEFVEAPSETYSENFGRPVSPDLVCEEEVNILFRQLDDCFEESDEGRERAYLMCEENYSKLKDNADFLWRYAYATYLKAQMTGANEKEKKKELYFQAKLRAQEGLAITDNNANVHKWFAIAAGGTTDYLSTQEKIKVGFLFKTHVEKAISLNPRDPTLYYLLGRWCLEVYSLTWFERKVAAALFTVPPTATIDESLNLLLKADNLRDEENKLKENYLYIAKCYIEMKDNGNAVHFLEKANKLPSKSQDDREAQSEVDTLLKKYR